MIFSAQTDLSQLDGKYISGTYGPQQVNNTVHFVSPFMIGYIRLALRLHQNNPITRAKRAGIDRGDRVFDSLIKRFHRTFYSKGILERWPIKTLGIKTEQLQVI
jgi:hypothetical protein